MSYYIVDRPGTKMHGKRVEGGKISGKMRYVFFEGSSKAYLIPKSSLKEIKEDYCVCEGSDKIVTPEAIIWCIECFKDVR
jgi:hypothetical protein